MFQNKTLAEFKQRFFSKFSKKVKTGENNKQINVSRSSSMCSIKVTSIEEIVEESLEKGLPIIPFGSPTFVIAEETERIPKGNNRQSSLKGLKGRILRQTEEKKENIIHAKNRTSQEELRNQKVKHISIFIMQLHFY